MAILDLKPGDVNFVLMKHDYGCPAIESRSMLDCTCNAEFEIATEQQWCEEVKKTRQQRRAAERAAEEAMRKAKKGGRNEADVRAGPRTRPGADARR